MKKRNILRLMCCLLVIFGLTGCSTGNSQKDDSKDCNIAIKQTEGMDVKAYISSGQDQLIVSVTNKSGKMIGSGYIEVSYYDENNEKIRIYGTDDTRYNMLENNSEIVYGFELPSENNIDHYIPAKTEVEITIDEEYQEQYSKIISQYVENFSYSYSTSNDIVTLTLKNNDSTSEYAPRSLSVVFYKNNRPVYSKAVWFLFTEVEAAQTVSREINIPNDYKKSSEVGEDVLIDYDNIKIFRIVDSSS